MVVYLSIQLLKFGVLAVLTIKQNTNNGLCATDHGVGVDVYVLLEKNNKLIFNKSDGIIQFTENDTLWTLKK